VDITPGAGVKVAADEAPYSGDTTQVQIVQLAAVTGAEGSKTLTKLGDPTDGIPVNLGANNDVTVTSSALPAGAATQTTLAAILSALGGTLTASVNTITGFATDTVLQAVRDRLPASIGQKASAASLPVVLSTEQQALLGGGGGGAITATDGALATVGTTTNAAITTDTAGTVIGFLRGLVALLSLVVDAANGWIRAEINELHYTEDSIKALGEDVTPYSEIVTVNTSTELVAAPAVGNHLVVKFFSYQLRENVSTTASLRAGASTTDYYPYDLDFTTMPLVGKKLNPDGWALPSATALNAKLSAAPATNGVRFNIESVTRPD
jgi:hypothetical protein